MAMIKAIIFDMEVL